MVMCRCLFRQRIQKDVFEYVQICNWHFDKASWECVRSSPSMQFWCVSVSIPTPYIQLPSAAHISLTLAVSNAKQAAEPDRMLGRRAAPLLVVSSDGSKMCKHKLFWTPAPSSNSSIFCLVRLAELVFQQGHSESSCTSA